MPVGFVTDPSKAKEIVWKVLLSENRPFITEHVSDHLSGVVRKTVAQIALDELVVEKKAESKMIGDMKTYYGIQKLDDDEENLAQFARREAFLKRLVADNKKPMKIVSAVPRKASTKPRPKGTRRKCKRSDDEDDDIRKRSQLLDRICGTSAYPDDDFICSVSVSSSSSS